MEIIMYSILFVAVFGGGYMLGFIHAVQKKMVKHEECEAKPND